jgi:hypothetical protein
VAYAHGDWEFDLFRRTREFVRLHAVASKDPNSIHEAKEICEQFTNLIEDIWDFEEAPKRKRK